MARTISIKRTQNIGCSNEGDFIELILIDGRLGIEYSSATQGLLVQFTLSDSETSVLADALVSHVVKKPEDDNEITSP